MLPSLLAAFYRVLLVTTCSIGALHAQIPDAAAIVKRADDRMRGQSSIAQVSIQIIRPSWSRELSLRVWSKGERYALVLVQAPARDRGIAYLKRNKEVWNWIPSIERTIKLPPSMMSQSWMGTDFTHDDLVKEASIVTDYNSTWLRRETVRGRDCHVIQLIPKPKAAIVWGKVLLWIDTETDNLWQADYFDEREVRINHLEASDPRMLGGRWLPSILDMSPVAKPGYRTRLTYHNLQFDTDISDAFFSPAQMQKLQ